MLTKSEMMLDFIPIRTPLYPSAQLLRYNLYEGDKTSLFKVFEFNHISHPQKISVYNSH